MAQKLDTIRHSLAHIMAHSVLNLYPKTKFGIGPTTEDGFHYDFDLPLPISQNDLQRIEKEMKKLIEKNLSFKKKFITPNEAKKIFKDQPYKLELIEELKKQKEKISIYIVGDFLDLCRGPHIKSTKELKNVGFKLTKIAGAYWRGDEKKPMLTRIYGVAFENEKKLKEYLEKIEEAKKRDHRLLGHQLRLFLFDEDIGQGLPVWFPKGAILRKIITDYLFQELNKAGYQWIVSPHIANIKLWQTSGHWDFYRENIYSPIEIENEKYLLKPMNCPFHVKVYNSQIRSYKNLPIKYAEFGTVYRYEKSGVLHGLTRVRGFTQDDAHIICTKEQMEKEIEKLVKLAIKILKTFSFSEFEIYLATRPKKFIGTKTNWQKATKALRSALDKMKLEYKIDKGGGAFYGPKIDIKIKDSLGRPWQCTTIQVDFNLPQKFQMKYVDKNGKKREPIMIHRALLGSLERFIGVLLEHYGGALPLWLSPTQVWVIPLSQKFERYAKEVYLTLKEAGIRVELKNERETLSKKIREGQIQKIPYMVVVGKEEEKKKSVRPRERRKGDLGEVKLKEFLKKIKIEIEKKK
ncbi:MAG: threonine--tRNA ligase [Candidatus Pacebacteria bacterium]|nr:threonine--tRNA ligase [Candidatus Paceibacterota bacterium]